LKDEWAGARFTRLALRSGGCRFSAGNVADNWWIAFCFPVESFPQSVDVVKHVGEDSAGIGFASGNIVAPEVKLIMIAEKNGGHYAPLSASRW